MSKMVLLELLVPQRKVLVVKEVMCEIVADVSKDTATVGCTSSIPVVEEYSMCKLPERSSQSSEERRRHDKTILVHREIMMDAVKDEMKCDSNTVVGQIAIKVSVKLRSSDLGNILVKMEQKAMQDIFNYGPEEHAEYPVAQGEELVVKTLRSNPGAVRDARQPDRRNNPPGGLGERLKEVSKQRRRLASLVVARTMDLVKIKFLGETTEPDLREERSVQVEELVLLVVQVIVCVPAQVLRARHSGSGVDGAICVSVGFTIG